MVRQLQPWFEHMGKRQVKAPKVFFRDSGLLHHLLDLPTRHQLLGHPMVGASVVHPGQHRYPMAEGITAISLTGMHGEPSPDASS